jgi:hypothetical protein
LGVGHRWVGFGGLERDREPGPFSMKGAVLS